MLTLLQQLFTRPYYHLFLAGPSRSCSRASFLLAITYAYILSKALVQATSDAFKHYLHTTNFPYHQFGFPECRWKSLMVRDTPAYPEIMATYLPTHGATITLIMQGITYGTLLLSLYMLWRIFMLVLQRCNGTHLNPTLATSITALLVALFITTNALFESPTSVAASLWLLVLAFLPPKSPPTATATNWAEKWLLHPTCQGFSLALRTPISGFNFALGLLAIFSLPIMILLITTQLAATELMTNNVGMAAADNTFICNLALLAQEDSPFNYRRATIFLKAFSLIPSSLMPTSQLLLAELATWITNLFMFALITRRLLTLGVRFPWAWSLLSMAIFTLSAIAAAPLGYIIPLTILQLAFYGILATLKPYQA